MSAKKVKGQKPVKDEPTAEELFSAIAAEQEHILSIPGTSTQDVVKMIENMTTMLNSLYQLHITNSKVAENCVRMLSELQVKTDTIGQAVSYIQTQLRNSNDSSVAGPSAPSPFAVKCPFKPVNTLDQLISLDSKAADPDFIKHTVQVLGCIHGENRYVGDGGSVSLRIFDLFFDRKFMVSCSWTGTGKNSKKIPFIGYIMLYYYVVRYSDQTYTLDETKDFLHRCLRNAKQRSTELSGKKAASRKRKLVKLPSDALLEDESEGEGEPAFEPEDTNGGVQGDQENQEEEPEGDNRDHHDEDTVEEPQQADIDNEDGEDSSLNENDLKIEMLDEDFL